MSKTAENNIKSVNVEKIAEDLNARVGDKLDHVRTCLVTALDSINRDTQNCNDEAAGMTAIAFLNLFDTVLDDLSNELMHMTDIIKSLAA